MQEHICPLAQKHTPPGSVVYLGKTGREELIPKSHGSHKTREKKEPMISVSGEDLCFPHIQSTQGSVVLDKNITCRPLGTGIVPSSMWLQPRPDT